MSANQSLLSKRLTTSSFFLNSSDHEVNFFVKLFILSDKLSPTTPNLLKYLLLLLLLPALKIEEVVWVVAKGKEEEDIEGVEVEEREKGSSLQKDEQYIRFSIPNRTFDFEISGDDLISAAFDPPIFAAVFT